MSASSIRQHITDQIITALEGNLVPWRRPWRTTSGRHANFQTRRPYSGVNPLLLEIHALNHGLSSNLWATFEQWKKLGCTVKPRPRNVQAGAWGCRVIFYRPVTKTVTDTETGTEQEKHFPILKTFTVFNADQVAGAAVAQLQETETGSDHDPHELAEALIAATEANICIGGNQAVYFRPQPEDSFPNHTAADYIVMPTKQSFATAGTFYETAFHELAHWSEVRVGFDHKKHGYAFGELVAEIAACQISSELGIENGEDLKNHAAYLKNWLQAMRSDSGFILRAATQASKVTDFLLSFVKSHELTKEYCHES